MSEVRTKDLGTGGGAGMPVQWLKFTFAAAANCIDGNYWICPPNQHFALVGSIRPETSGAKYTPHILLGTNSSAGGVMIEKCTGTTAPGSGTALYTAAKSFIVGAVNTPLTLGTLLTDPTYFAPGDRLAFDFTSPTDVVGVVIMLPMVPTGQAGQGALQHYIRTVF